MTARALTAREAAAELNISRATLYAYVSRGLIRSEPVDGARHRLYLAEDVRALRHRKWLGRGEEGEPRREAQSLEHGAPIMDSAITLIDDGRLYYRGRDAAALARVASLETVCGLLWQCGPEDPFGLPAPDSAALDPGPLGAGAAIRVLARAAEDDLQAFNLSPPAVAATGARILRLVTAAFVGTAPARKAIHDQLAEAWSADAAAADLIRAALVVSADHELNASTFTVRCVASTRATPFAAVIAGIAALQGPRHGGMTAKVTAWFDEVRAAAGPRQAVAERLRRGDPLPGLGHPLYGADDPRARLLLELLQRQVPEAVGATLDLVAAAQEATGLRPSLDFALVSLERCLGLPTGAAFALFAIGRTAGWIAHAQEQYRRPELIRPRARYIGEPPEDSRPQDSRPQDSRPQDSRPQDSRSDRQ